MTTILRDYRPILMVVTFGFLAFAFYLTYRPRRTQAAAGEAAGAPAARIMTFNKIMLWAVTVMAVAFLFGGQYIFQPAAEPTAEITADMTQTVVQIEGMT